MYIHVDSTWPRWLVCPTLGLLGDDVGHHNCLTMLVLGFTDVVSKVDGLHVVYSHDALGDPRGVAHTSVNQPPGSLDANWTVVLRSKIHQIYYHYVICL